MFKKIQITISAVFIIVLVLASTQNNLVSALVNQQGLGIYPTDSNTQDILSKGWFIEKLNPGESKKRKVTVSNYSQEEKTVKLTSEDRIKNTGDSFSFTNKEQAKKEVGTWIKLSKDELTIPAQKSVDIEFTITVPKDIKSGEYAGVIGMQEVKKDQKLNAGINVVNITGARIYITIPGDLKVGTSIKKFEFITPESSVYNEFLATNYFQPIEKNAFLTLRLQNTGNIFQKIKGKIEIQTPKGMVTEDFDRDYAPFDEEVAISSLSTKVEWTPGEYTAKFTIENSPVIISNKQNQIKDTDKFLEVKTKAVITQATLDKIKTDKEDITKKQNNVVETQKTAQKVEEGDQKEFIQNKDLSKDGTKSNEIKKDSFLQIVGAVFAAGLIIILLLVGIIIFLLKFRSKKEPKSDLK